MVKTMRTLGFLIIILLASSVTAQENWQASADYRWSRDSDEATFKGPLYGFDHLRSNRQFEGLRYGHRTYEEPLTGGSASFKELHLTGRQNLSETVTASGSVILLDGDIWSPVLFNLNMVWEPAPKWRLEGYVEKDLLGTTTAALEDEIDILITGVVIEYALTSQLSVLTNLTHMEFGDGNERERQALMAIWSLPWVEGLSLRGEVRQSKTDFNPAQYFAPATHDQAFASVRYVKALDEREYWWLLLEAGAGRQKINGISEEAHKYRISLDGPVTDRVSMKAEYACTSDGGNYQYEFCSGTVGLSYRW